MKCSKRNHPRSALICVCSIIAITTFWIEYLSYLHNSRKWSQFGKGEDVIVRVLFVADPQIQGEKNEHYLYGWFSRWDADNYLRKNYQLARDHVSPDVIVFLGDLFDEGSIASDEEYRRYYQRFAKIFDLPMNGNASNITHLFVPGDNDVGGEGGEPINPLKVDYFRNAFGDLKSVVNFSERGMDVQFVKINLFMPSEYSSPNVINGSEQPVIRLIVSHISLLSHISSNSSVEQVLEALRPNLIVAAHSHKSSYSRLVFGQRKPFGVIQDFLLDGKSHAANSNSPAEATVRQLPEPELLTQTSVRLDLKSIIGQEVHEIIVPTCSYRMGVYDMGYGAMKIYRNGTVEYAVLWLPSRFKQFLLYIVNIAMCIIVMKLKRKHLWRIRNYVYKKRRQYRQCRIRDIADSLKIV